MYLGSALSLLSMTAMPRGEVLKSRAMGEAPNFRGLRSLPVCAWSGAEAHRSCSLPVFSGVDLVRGFLVLGGP